MTVLEPSRARADVRSVPPAAAGPQAEDPRPDGTRQPARGDGEERVDGRRPLGRHLVALTLALLVFLPLLGGRGLFSGDEGAAIAQARLLVDKGSWGFEIPRPDLDPEGDLRPFDRGDPATGAPFAKHPAYPAVLVPFVALAGTAGAKLASLIGTLLAAAAAALIARRLRPGSEVLALWVAGLASPLLFNGWVVIGHSLAAACCGFAAIVALSVVRTDRAGPVAARRWGLPLAAAGLVSLLFGAVLLRNEAVLFGIALGVASVLVAARIGSGRLAGLGVLALGGTAVGYVADTALTGLVASPEQPFVVNETLSSSNYLVDRILPTAQTLVMPVRGGVSPVDLLPIVVLAAAVTAAVIIRRRPADRSGIVLMAVIAAGAALLRLSGPSTAIPGLLTAFPLLPVGLVLLPRERWRQASVLLLAVTSALFLGAVLATQYSTGGTAEWGFRYGTLALPLLVPPAVVGLIEGTRRVDRDVRLLAAGALVVVSVSLAALSLQVLDRQHRLGVDVVATVEAVRSESDRPVVVTSYLPLGRMAWEEILAGQDWVLTPVGGDDDLAERLTADGGDIVLVTQDVDREITPYEGTHEIVSRVDAVPSGQLEVVRLARR